MSTLLNLEILVELYPNQEERIKFLRRAQILLHRDCVALQDALALHAYENAQELVHRLQGTASFLTGSREHAAGVFRPLSEALTQQDLSPSSVTQTSALQYLHQLEDAVSNAIPADRRMR